MGKVTAFLQSCLKILRQHTVTSMLKFCSKISISCKVRLLVVKSQLSYLHLIFEIDTEFFVVFLYDVAKSDVIKGGDDVNEALVIDATCLKAKCLPTATSSIRNQRFSEFFF